MSRGILVFLFIMALETVHGILRGLFLVPRVGEKLSGLIGWPVAMVIVMVVSTLLIGWTRVTGTAALLRLGVVWAVLTFIFEICRRPAARARCGGHLGRNQPVQWRVDALQPVGDAVGADAGGADCQPPCQHLAGHRLRSRLLKRR